MLCVNQLNANIKLVEIWKAINVGEYPLKLDRQKSHESRVSTRAETLEKPIEIGKSSMTQKTCVSDAIHLWNLAPDYVTNYSRLAQAKSEIKKF